MEEYDALIEDLARFELDPLGFVYWAFPWGEPGPLEHEELEEWQIEALTVLRDKLRQGLALYDAMDAAKNVIPPIRVSRSTGHGVGKSALAAMLTWWAMSTMPDTKGVVTANTETQLKTKTWPEIAKWHRMFIARDLFDVTATAIFPKDPVHQRTWRIDIVPWSKHNTEAFAGLHNMWRRIFVLFDESSAIDDVIHEVTEGAMTDAHTQIIWFQFGNPTKNSGRFRETASDGKFGHRWDFRALDSRMVRRTNKAQIEEWKQDYGEDSDFFRVRVKGMFPRADAISFISFDTAREAGKRELPEVNEHDMVLGVDVARFGDDSSCIYPRRGRDARSHSPRLYKGLDTVGLAFKVRDAILELLPIAVFVDGTGLGAGVVDRLNEMRLGVGIYEVQFGAAVDGLLDEAYANKRAEIWGCMRDWLKTGCIPEHIRGLEHPFMEELCAPTYGFNNRDEIQLESKKDMRRRGVASPDAADALACTFALPMLPAQRDRYGHLVPAQAALVPDYDPYEVI
jgi:hypothetical protein